MARTYTPAEVFPAGEYLWDELGERGWTVTEFAEIIGRPIQAVSEILNGKKEITTETAISFSEALGTTSELWLNLQTAYRLFEQRSVTSQEELTPVARRARLRQVIPLAQVRSRGWIPETDDLDAIESAVCELLEIANLDERPRFAAAAKRSNSADPITIEQAAWLGYVRKVADSQDVAEFETDELRRLATRLPRILKDGPSELVGLPMFGIRGGPSRRQARWCGHVSSRRPSRHWPDYAKQPIRQSPLCFTARVCPFDAGAHHCAFWRDSR